MEFKHYAEAPRNVAEANVPPARSKRYRVQAAQCAALIIRDRRRPRRRGDPAIDADIKPISKCLSRIEDHGKRQV